MSQRCRFGGATPRWVERGARPAGGRTPSVALALLLTLASTAPLLAEPPARAGGATPGAAAELRRTEPAFGGTAAVEVRDLPPLTAATALAAAFEEIHEVERLAASAARLSGVDAEPRPPIRIDPRLARLLDRARSFCLWSNNAHGPLGGRLYALGRPAESAGPGIPSARVAAVESARCTDLAVDATAATVQIPAGAEIDLTGFAAGYAADRAADALRAAGAANAVIEVGTVVLAFGPGPEGRGWPVELPTFPGTDGPLDRLLLRDQALAVATTAARPPSPGGLRHDSYIDQRTGRRPQGTLATAAAAELGIDAEALAVTSLILGNREATFLLGQLRPAPAILWLLGTGTGHPLITSYHWSQVRKD